jgi:glycosyltransferase involved in cell wall biosynthesis
MMRENPKVSVIVPVWNPGPGISRCVESLRGQTLEDIEMIFVDDCSTDNAMDVVRAAAKEDPRIRILTNEENMGAGASRNVGIEVARGEYLSFMDSDDYVDSNFLDVLYHKGKTKDIDIVKGGLVYEYKGGTTKSNSYTLNEVIQKGLKDGCPLFLLFSYEHPSTLFHRRLFVSPVIRYGLSRNAEDTTFLLKACHTANGFEIDDHVAYHYVYRNDSASNVITKASLESRIEALRDEVDFLITCVEPNLYAIQYFMRRIKYYLSLERYVFKKVGIEKEVLEFHADLQAIASNYPAIGMVKNNDMTILALVEYGVGLAERPYHSPWEVPQPEDYADVVVRHINFLQSHPEHYKELPTLISKANWFAKQMKLDGIQKEEIEAYEKQIRVLWRKPLIMWMLFKSKLSRLLVKLKRKCFDKKIN